MSQDALEQVTLCCSTMCPLCFFTSIFFSLSSFLFFHRLINSPQIQALGHFLSTPEHCSPSSRRNSGGMIKKRKFSLSVDTVNFLQMHQLGLCSTAIDRNCRRSVIYKRYNLIVFLRRNPKIGSPWLYGGSTIIIDLCFLKSTRAHTGLTTQVHLPVSRKEDEGCIFYLGPPGIPTEYFRQKSYLATTSV